MDSQKDMQVLTLVRKDVLDWVLIDNRMDLISYPYYSVLDKKNFTQYLERPWEGQEFLIYITIKLEDSSYGTELAL